MIFGVLKLKFDEDKAYSLSSQILTKSAKSAQKTSRYLKATNVAKFAHLNTHSTFLNPALSAKFLFSASV